eukprot:CAMPEP_0206437758 /NCGR_PEP_ID=MMETSP0324_2-20121206/11220_1 /ASSEMBLY_ACC=CAM_ASM_000836 /TAXON_ID=2866 /ORGANISM="Crypthecodinium cohnii, Strain Seligo" /LENGTH=269 /DNA_ID=CAMNT_0053905077 /DNA_START=31 /DNA_END=839 /DNA_ORIENTATION=-
MRYLRNRRLSADMLQKKPRKFDVACAMGGIADLFEDTGATHQIQLRDVEAATTAGKSTGPDMPTASFGTLPQTSSASRTGESPEPQVSKGQDHGRLCSGQPRALLGQTITVSFSENPWEDDEYEDSGCSGVEQVVQNMSGESSDDSTGGRCMLLHLSNVPCHVSQSDLIRELNRRGFRGSYSAVMLVPPIGDEPREVFVEFIKMEALEYFIEVFHAKPTTWHLDFVAPSLGLDKQTLQHLRRSRKASLEFRREPLHRAEACVERRLEEP